MSALNNSALIGASGSTGYQISRSVRLRSSASAYLTRTPASAGNRQTWTWSGWVKRGSLAASNQMLFSSDNGTSNTTWLEFGFDSAHAFYVTSYTADVVSTTAVFRDPSAWYHIVVQFDSTQATSANRCRIYFNGVQQAVTGAGFTLNASYGVNAAQAHDIGRRNWPSGVGLYTDGYLTEINFIDGQALTPSSFGETNPVTGVWQPKRYVGTYGTNGFYLNFADNSNNTAATIGKDSSGNGNNWTPNNISVTSGVTYDSMLDVPTPWPDGGNGRGNYATLNPLKGFGGLNSSGNLNITNGTSAFVTTIAAPQSGKWYFEFSTPGNTASTTCGVFARPMDSVLSAIGDVNTASTTYYRNDGALIENGSTVATYTAWSTGANVIGVALDMDAKTIRYYLNNTAQGASARNLLSTTSDYTVAIFNYISGQTLSCNFGQRPFAYTPPSGFNALNTQNLPTPTIAKGNLYFDATLWTGNSTANRAITNAGGFAPDFVWIKDRSVANFHNLFDTSRGAGKRLVTNATSAEETNQAFGYLSSFNSDGFSVTNGASGYDNVNLASDAYVGWQWKEGATQGFDIVTYTGNGANRTIAHNLGVAPSMMIVKNRSSATNWKVWHSALAGTEYLEINNTTAKQTAATVWNSTTPTSSVFSVGTSGDVNANGSNFVAYLFAPVAGFSAFGSYTGNGSADGAFVFCGFRPRWIMFKRTDSAGNSWILLDTARNTYNAVDAFLSADLSNAESTSYPVDFNANGFKLRATTSNLNANGGTYVYACFAENPLKYALAR